MRALVFHSASVARDSLSVSPPVLLKRSGSSGTSRGPDEDADAGHARQEVDGEGRGCLEGSQRGDGSGRKTLCLEESYDAQPRTNGGLLMGNAIWSLSRH